MRLEKHHAVALCVDMQDRLFPHIHEHEALLLRCVTLIKGLQILAVPIVVTQQYTTGLGATIAPIAAALGEFDPIEKMTFSCCGSDTVEAILLGSARHAVIVFGIETHVCILQTALDLKAQGQNVYVVADCVASRNPQEKKVAIRRMRDAGITITTTESILFELLRRADTPEFKQISALVK
ncbi:MAG: hydrolase [Candidatus Kapabacteria bacterium]|nr:hydrolase [Candidatus Kapabacteria bacterium]